MLEKQLNNIVNGWRKKLMENRIDIIDAILKYQISKKYIEEEKRNEINKIIDKMNLFLLKDKNEEIRELCEEFFRQYSSDKLAGLGLNEYIYKQRADEQGLSATSGYSQIYFNEIIQNANDCTQGTELDIAIKKENDVYEMQFRYEEKGFSVKNIVGFMGTEIHTKKDDASATGKHGLGIKSLFYFVDYLKIVSNIEIEIEINLIENENSTINQSIKKNDDWDKKHTILIIRFSDKEEYHCKFNVKKLVNFIQKMYREEERKQICEEVFFGTDQDKLIFDARNLIFTDKNKGKKVGIKKINFYLEDFKNEPIHSIFCDEKQIKIEKHKVEISHCEIKNGNEDKNSLSYLVFKLEGDQNNFTVAFPENMEKGVIRYYETYYLPEQNKDDGTNILINSTYSNPSRTKLSDSDKETIDIKEKIKKKLFLVYRIMTEEECATSEFGEFISKIFHQSLILEIFIDNYIDKLFIYQINNRYLKKYKYEDNNKYIVYNREEEEKYEKKYFEQKLEKESVKKFFENFFLKDYKYTKDEIVDDTIQYRDELFIDWVKNAYNKAIDEQSSKLNRILNFVPNIKNLIYYRLKQQFPNIENITNNGIELKSDIIDEWNKRIWEMDTELGEEKKKENVECSLLILGRYGLSNNIDDYGNIIRADFWEYIFNVEDTNSDTYIIEPYPTMKQKGEEEFKKYKKLKEKLHELFVNPDGGEWWYQYKKYSGGYEIQDKKQIKYLRGQMPFYQGSHGNSYNNTLYKRPDTDKNEYNTEKFESEYSKLLIEKIKESIQSEEICFKPIITEFNGKINESIILFLRGGQRDDLIESYSQNVYGFLDEDTPLVDDPNNRKPIFQYVTFTRRVININFLKNMLASSFEDFKFYFDFLKLMKAKKTHLFSSYASESWEIKTKDKINVSSCDIIDIFSWLYKEKDYVSWFADSSPIKCDFQIKLKDDFINNIKNECDEDLFRYIETTTKKKVYLIRAGKVQNRKDEEIMLLYKWWIYLRKEKGWRLIGEYQWTNENDIFIVFSGEEPKKVLETVYRDFSVEDTNVDLANKIKAFIPKEQNSIKQGMGYCGLTDRKNDGNEYSRKVGEKLANVNINGHLSVEQLKGLILARGNNNGKCCCCNQEIEKKENAELIMTMNQNEDTNKEYPMVIQVVCSQCKGLLEQSHYSTNLIKEEEYYIEYCCRVSNARQIKKVKYKIKVMDGVLMLYKKI